MWIKISWKITKNQVITAAHCFYDIDDESPTYQTQVDDGGDRGADDGGGGGDDFDENVGN